MSATDADSGLNGRVRYTLGGSGSVEAFVMDPVSGVVRTAKSLDRESIAQYEIQALAIDRGTPALTGTVSIVTKHIFKLSVEGVFYKEGNIGTVCQVHVFKQKYLLLQCT